MYTAEVSERVNERLNQINQPGRKFKHPKGHTMARRRITLADQKRQLRYRETPPKQFGDLHQRMKYAMQILGRHPELAGSDLLSALFDLETEVSMHEPAHPPYGRRTISAVQAFGDGTGCR